MTVTRLGWSEALAAVKVTRPCAAPNLGFQHQLQEFESTQADQVWGEQLKVDPSGCFACCDILCSCSSENGYKRCTRTAPPTTRLTYVTYLPRHRKSTVIVRAWKKRHPPRQEQSDLSPRQFSAGLSIFYYLLLVRMSITTGTALLMYQTSTLPVNRDHDMQHIHLQLFFFWDEYSELFYALCHDHFKY